MGGIGDRGRGSEGWARSGAGGAEAPRKLKLAPPGLAAVVLSNKACDDLELIDGMLVALGETEDEVADDVALDFTGAGFDRVAAGAQVSIGPGAVVDGVWGAFG